MKTPLSLCLIVASLCPVLGAQTTLDTEIIKKMVVFIFAADARDKTKADEKKPLGTGFLILAPAKGTIFRKERVQNVKGQLLLITARHIFDPAWAYCSEPQPDVLFLRVNKKEYDPQSGKPGIAYVPITLLKDGVRQYFIRDDDDEVDAAVIDVGLALSEGNTGRPYDVMPMSLSSFASPDEIKRLEIGDPVASPGLLPGRSGELRNYPFFKFGAISNIPGESTWTGCGGKLELRLERVWFIAANLVGGNSGSPLFYDLPPLCAALHCVKGLTRGAIIGVQSSSFGDAQFGNQGIAAMTPIEDVFKIIEKNARPSVDLFRGDESLHNQDIPNMK